MVLQFRNLHIYNTYWWVLVTDIIGVGDDLYQNEFVLFFVANIQHSLICVVYLDPSEFWSTAYFSHKNVEFVGFGSDFTGILCYLCIWHNKDVSFRIEMYSTGIILSSCWTNYIRRRGETFAQKTLLTYNQSFVFFQDISVLEWYVPNYNLRGYQPKRRKWYHYLQEKFSCPL